MKLKKIFSLMLVFAMIVTVFGATSVAAEGTANLNYVIYNANGDAEVTEALEVGKIYQVAFTMKDISAKKAKSAQITVAYNTEVVELVDESGAAGSDYDVVIERTDFYDKKSKTGYYENVSLDTASVAGRIDYALGVAKELSEDIRTNGVDNDGSFEIVRFRFKTKANGKLGFALATSDMGEGNYNDTNPDGIIFANNGDVEVTEIPCAARVGEVAFVSATADADFAAAKTYVVGKTDAETVLADLAKDYASVKVTYVDEEGGEAAKDAAIVWAADKAFDAASAGTYTFVGTVTTPEGVNYTGSAVTVEATITIDTLKVQEVKAIDDIVVRVTDEPALPTVVSVVITGGEVVELPVAWELVSLDPATGVSVLEGTITGTDNIDVDGKKATLKVIALVESQNKAPEAINAVAVNAAIDAEDIAADALVALPEFVVVTADNTFINVTWEQVSEAPEAGYALGDVITFKPVADGVTFPEAFVAEVTVAVPAGKEEVVFEATEFETEEIKNDAGYTLEDAIEDAAFAGKYADGTAADLSTIVWDFDGAAFDGETAGVYELTGTWADVYGNEATFTITINIVNAGATGVAIYNSAAAANPLTSLVLDAGDSKKIYAKLEPIGVEDTVTWSASKNYVTLTPSADTLSVTIRAKSAGTLDITATTSTGASATIKVLINSTNNGGSSSSAPSAYNSNPAVGQLLSNAAEEIEQQKVVEASSFADLGGYEWAATQVETLRLLSIVSGKTNTTYAPADSVTRAEFLAMLVRLFGFKANGEAKTFTDVPADAWFYDAVSVASSLGIAYGYENGAFDPNAVITRQDMAVFAARAVSVAGLTPERGIERAFNDQATISDYAKSAVSEMSVLGVINGMNDGNFAPAETANRAQAAVVVYNLYVIKNK